MFLECYGALHILPNDTRQGNLHRKWLKIPLEGLSGCSIEVIGLEVLPLLNVYMGVSFSTYMFTVGRHSINNPAI